jgi:cytochrome c oxidase subunit 2
MWDLFPAAASSYAGEIDYVIKLITYTVGAWLLAAYVILFGFLIAFRRKQGQPARYVPGRGRQMAWVLVPVFLVALCDFAIDLANTPIWRSIKEEIPETETSVRVLARQWSWEFVYPGPDGQFDTEDDVRNTGELHVKVHAKTRFEVTAADVLHSFAIPAFRLKQDAIPGRVIAGWFEATQTGRFDLQCAEICGTGHSVMAGRVVVHTPEEFNAFMTAHAGSAREPAVAAVRASASPILAAWGD